VLKASGLFGLGWILRGELPPFTIFNFDSEGHNSDGFALVRMGPTERRLEMFAVQVQRSCPRTDLDSASLTTD